MLLGNPQTVANYSYDPYGVRKVNSGYRSPFPFLFHGLEQEYYDSLKLYWEPNGNVYNPDPFQLSLSGPQGLGGGGGAFPRAVRGPGSNPQANIALDVYDATANVVALTGGIPICWNDSCGTFFLPGLDGLFGGDSKPTIPWYDTTHKSRGAHDVYCRVQGICGAIVTQKGNIILAQSDGGGEGGEDEGDAILEEGQGKAQFDQNMSAESTLDTMGQPDWAHTDGGFLNWLRQMQDPQGPPVSNGQADAIVHEARRLGLNVRPDLAGHAGGNPWQRPHLNIIGKSLSVHVNVPNNYKLP